jgi:hypothetical protein
MNEKIVWQRKLNIFIAIFLTVCFLGCAGSPPSTSKDSSLDGAIEKAAENTEARLKSGTRVALINVRSPSEQFSEYVLTYLESILVNNEKLVVVDRSNLDKIRQELGFQLSGEVSDESAKAIGKMLGAGAIITGTLITLDSSYRLTLKAIDVETATVVASYPADITDDGRIRTLLASGSTAAVTSSRQPSASSQPAVNQQIPAYKLGDIGPAGGIIFYDKGNSIGGWRYLEAAPAETEKELIFGDLFVGVTGRRIGDGKENTNKFAEYMQRRGGGVNTATWYCNQLVINGFDDWYLPSTDELLYLYNNLYLKNIGGLMGKRYWSSTYNSSNGIQCVDFDTGNQRGAFADTGTKFQGRAIRQF